jgi:site-specific DNA recombinase
MIMSPSLPRPLLTDRDDPIFQDAHLQPFLDQADDAPVADPMLQEANQPFLADFIEGRYDTLPISAMFRLR